jgi:hypothetical protein
MNAAVNSPLTAPACWGSCRASPLQRTDETFPEAYKLESPGPSLQRDRGFSFHRKSLAIPTARTCKMVATARLGEKFKGSAPDRNEGRVISNVSVPRKASAPPSHLWLIPRYHGYAPALVGSITGSHKTRHGLAFAELCPVEGAHHLGISLVSNQSSNHERQTFSRSLRRRNQLDRDALRLPRARH